MADELTFYVHLRIKPEFVNVWRQAFDELVAQMANEDTFVGCVLHQDLEHDNFFTLYEQWREPSVPDFMRRQVNEKPYRLAYEEKLAGWLAEPRIASATRSLQSWQAKG